MNIQEVLRLGKPFKRYSWNKYWTDLPIEQVAISGNKTTVTIGLTREDILATDWELEPEKKLITRTQLLDMYALGLKHAHGYYGLNHKFMTIEERELSNKDVKEALNKIGFDK